jgi:hypothetical protein
MSIVIEGRCHAKAVVTPLARLFFALYEYVFRERFGEQHAAGFKSGSGSLYGLFFLTDV